MNPSQQDRKKLLQDWLYAMPAYAFSDVVPASADASFRRYFRTADKNTGQSYVVMDAPPEKEDCEPFIRVTKLLRTAGVNAPEIIEQDLEQGFLLLTDLGDQPYLDHLSEQHAETLYSDAVSSLIHMQNIKAEAMNELPLYDGKRLLNEMALFEEWYLNRHLEVQLSDEQKIKLAATFDLLIQSAFEQPQTFVHRDYHSRNLMLTQKHNPGIIDYQDAVVGPCTYDLVSLFKDCYIEWPREKIEQWLEDYLYKSGLAHEPNFETAQFIKWFDFMGVQRHLKVLGIFARLNYRDGKKQYLDDLPLTLKYVVDACERYEELKPLQQILEQTVLGHPKVKAT